MMKFLMMLSLLLASTAYGGPAKFAYEGKLTNTLGVPVVGNPINFKIQIRSGNAADCLLYEEDQALNMSAGDGYFSMDVGSGTPVIGTMAQALTQTSMISGITCTSGATSYTPAAADARKLRVQFYDGVSWQMMSQDLVINSAPFAMVADTLQGLGPSNFLQPSGQTTQTNLNSVFDTTAHINEIIALAAGTSTTYAKASGGSFSSPIQISAGALPVGATGKIAIDSADGNKLKYFDGTSWVAAAGGVGSESDPTVMSFAKNAPSSNFVTAGSMLDLAATGVAAGAYGTSNSVATFTVDSQGRLTGAGTANIAIPSSRITQSGAAANDVLQWNGTAWAPSAISSVDSSKVLKAGDTMTGLLYLSADPSAASGAATKQYVDSVSNTAVGAYVKKDGTTALTGDWDLDGASVGSRKITGLANPTVNDGAATKLYVDTAVSAVSAGTITSVSGTAGQITSSGGPAPVLSLATLSSSGSYGSNYQVPSLTIDTYGRVTAVSMQSIAINAAQINPGAASVNDVLKWTGAAWTPSAISAGAESDPTVLSFAKNSLSARLTTSGSNNLDLASGVVSVGSVGSSWQSATIGVDTYGRVTSASYNPIAIQISQLTASGASVGQVPKWNGSSWVASADNGAGAETDPYVQSFARNGNTPASRLSIAGNILDLATVAGVAGSYGSASQVPFLSVDNYGRVSAASMQSIAINPSQINPSSASVGDVLKWTGAAWAPAAVSFGSTETDPTVHSFAKMAPSPRLTFSGGGLDLANVGASYAIGSAGLIPVLTVDIYGRVVSASTAAISVAPSQITSGSAAANDVLKWNGIGWAPSSSAVTEFDPTVQSFAKIGNSPTARFTINGSNQLDLASGIVAAGSYGTVSQVPTIGVDTYGRVTSASYSPIAIAISQLTASGASVGQVPKWNGSSWVATPDAGITVEADSTVQSFAKIGNTPTARFMINGSNQLDLASGIITAGSYGSASQIPMIGVDTYGRVTSASYAIVNDTSKLPLSGGVMTGDLNLNGNKLLAASAVMIDQYANSSNLYLNRANNVVGSPTAVLTGDKLASLVMQGYSASASFGPAAQITSVARENWTAAAHGAALGFEVTPIGASVPQERLKIDSNGNIGIGNSTPASQLYVFNGLNGQPALSVQAANGQSVNIAEFKNFSNTVLASISSTGALNAPSGLNATNATLSGATTLSGTSTLSGTTTLSGTSTTVSGNLMVNGSGTLTVGSTGTPIMEVKSVAVTFAAACGGVATGTAFSCTSNNASLTFSGTNHAVACSPTASTANNAVISALVSGANIIVNGYTVGSGSTFLAINCLVTSW